MPGRDTLTLGRLYIIVLEVQTGLVERSFIAHVEKEWVLTGAVCTQDMSNNFLTDCHTRVKDPRLSYCLPIAGERLVGFIHIPKVLVICEMRAASSRI